MNRVTRILFSVILILFLLLLVCGCGRARSDVPVTPVQTTSEYERSQNNEPALDIEPVQDSGSAQDIGTVQGSGPTQDVLSVLDNEPVQDSEPTQDNESGHYSESAENSEVVRDSFQFLFFSDTQPDPEIGDYSGFGDLLKQALERGWAPDMVIFGGDTVNDGGDETEWHDFWQSVGTSLDGTSMAAVAGNHDSYALLAEQFDYPIEAPAGQGKGYFYSMSMGPVFFLMLDSNIMGAANQADIDWLENELQSEAARRADWIIAVMHHPMWPAADIPKDIQRADTMRKHFLPLFESFGVGLILCGHQHVYSRTLPMQGMTAASGGIGIVQIMAASGDKATYASSEQEFISVTAEAPNYVYIEADSNSLVITACNGENVVIDELLVSNK